MNKICKSFHWSICCSTKPHQKLFEWTGGWQEAIFKEGKRKEKTDWTVNQCLQVSQWVSTATCKTQWTLCPFSIRAVGILSKLLKLWTQRSTIRPWARYNSIGKASDWERIHFSAQKQPHTLPMYFNSEGWLIKFAQYCNPKIQHQRFSSHLAFLFSIFFIFIG